MAFASGTTTSPTLLLAALNTFMTANGWTLHDNLGINDKVYFSDGLDNNQNMYIRVTLDGRFLDFGTQTGNFTVGQIITGATSGAQALILAQTDAGATGTLTLVNITKLFTPGETITDPLGGSAAVVKTLRYPTNNSVNDIENALDWLNVRSYTFWNATTHVGVNESGRLGPTILQAPHSTVPYPVVAFRPNLKTATQTPYVALNMIGDLYARNNNDAALSSQNCGYLYGTMMGRPLSGAPNPLPAVGGPQLKLRFTALNTFGKSVRDHAVTTASSTNSGLGFFVDLPTAKFKAISWAISATPATYFEVLDLLAPGTAAFIAAAPTTGSAGASTGVVWDGNDFIYVTVAVSTTTFMRYTISTNTWTTLAAIPFAPSLSQGVTYSPFFIQRGAIPGQDFNEIWYLNTTTVGSCIHRYNVEANTWSTLAAPVTPSAGTQLFCWDKRRTVYYKDTSTNTYAWVLDLQNLGAGWSTTMFDLGHSSAFRVSMLVNDYACRIRAHSALLTDYKFVGNADGVLVVTTINGQNWFGGFGKFNSFQPPAFANLTASALAGYVTLAVNDSSQFIIGDKINVVDRATGLVQATTIGAIPTAVGITCAMPLPTGATSFVTTDASNCVLYGDSFFAVTQLSVGGFEPNGQAAQYNMALAFDVSMSGAVSTPVTTRKQLWPINIQGNVAALSTFGVRGRLPSVYYVEGTPGEIITDRAGLQYLVIRSTSLDIFYNLPASTVAIGPIN